VLSRHLSGRTAEKSEKIAGLWVNLQFVHKVRKSRQNEKVVFFIFSTVV
jgi:hypothetical protein